MKEFNILYKSFIEGTYSDTPKNRSLNRVGEYYNSKKLKKEIENTEKEIYKEQENLNSNKDYLDYVKSIDDESQTIIFEEKIEDSKNKIENLKDKLEKLNKNLDKITFKNKKDLNKYQKNYKEVFGEINKHPKKEDYGRKVSSAGYDSRLLD